MKVITDHFGIFFYTILVIGNIYNLSVSVSKQQEIIRFDHHIIMIALMIFIRH